MPHRIICLYSLLGAAITFGAFFIFYGYLAHPLGPHYGGDFLNYWAGPRIARNHIPDLFSFTPYMAALTEHFGAPVYEHEWSYPLHSLFFLTPFAWLPYFVALAVWSLLGILAYALTLRLVLGGTHLLLPALLAPATLVCLFSGQNGLFISAGALLSLWLINHQRYVQAGLLLGCLTIKPHLFLLWPIFLLTRRLWRTIGVALITFVVLVGASVALHGPDAWHSYITITGAKQWHLLRMIPDQAGFYQWMMPGFLPGLRLLSIPMHLAVTLQCVMMLLIMVCSYRAFRQPLTLGQQALLLASASLLISPYGFNYDMPFLTAALLLRWQEEPPAGLQKIYFLTLFLAPALVYFTNSTPLPLIPLVLLITALRIHPKAL